MTHKEMTAHIRSRIKAAGIKARVRMMAGEIQVYTVKYSVEFTEEEQRKIRQIAVCNKLTWVRQMPIIVEQMTNPFDFNFYYNG